MFKGVVSTNKQIGANAVVIACSSSITEWDSCKIDVAVWVSSDDVEEVSPTASLLARNSSLVAACTLVAGNQFNKKSGNLEECVQEGSSNYTTPMSGKES